MRLQKIQSLAGQFSVSQLLLVACNVNDRMRWLVYRYFFFFTSNAKLILVRLYGKDFFMVNKFIKRDHFAMNSNGRLERKESATKDDELSVFIIYKKTHLVH